MRFRHTLQASTNALTAHKGRSALTILGIVIGVAAIIIVMSAGRGAETLILDQISGLGQETVIVRPGPGLSDFTNTLFSQSLTERDIEALSKTSNVPNMVSVTPFVIVPGSIEYQGERYNPTMMGGSAEFMTSVFSVRVEEGALFNDQDIDSNARVAVIGQSLREEIFENLEAIGENIQIGDTRFRVVAVLEEKSNVAGFDFNELVIIPHTAAQTYVTGNDYYNEVFIRADSVENIDKVVYDVTATLRDTHDISPGEEDDFNVQTQEDTADLVQSIISILTAFLGMVVAVSLLVGGIGIMNIMLVSVTERTKEIGLRKALGAKRSDILKQFLYEAVMLTGVGGIIGIIVGAVISFVLAIVLRELVDPNWKFVFPVSAVLLGIGMSVVVGMIFGIYPASQASKKSPIEALRYE